VTVLNHVRNFVVVNYSSDTLVIHSPTSIALVNRDNILLNATRTRQSTATADSSVPNKTSGV
jgi:hypothetical protein